MAMLKVLRSLSEVEQIPSSAEPGMTMERTQAELHQGRVRWDIRKDFSMERAVKHWKCPGR